MDEEALFAFYDQKNTEMSLSAAIQKGREMGLNMSGWFSFDRTTIPGVVSVNNGGVEGPDGRLNALDPADRTFAQRAGLRIALDFVKLARALPIPGLAHCSLLETGAAIGVRETRRVLCDYVVTLEDAKNCARFPDVVARRYGAVDQAGLADGEGERPTMQSGYDFPYRALLAQGLEGLLVAGRCGSYTHMGLAAGKSMGNMMAHRPGGGRRRGPGLRPVRRAARPALCRGPRRAGRPGRAPLKKERQEGVFHAHCGYAGPGAGGVHGLQPETPRL